MWFNVLCKVQARLCQKGWCGNLCSFREITRGRDMQCGANADCRMSYARSKGKWGLVCVRDDVRAKVVPIVFPVPFVANWTKRVVWEFMLFEEDRTWR